MHFIGIFFSTNWKSCFPGFSNCISKKEQLLMKYIHRWTNFIVIFLRKKIVNADHSPLKNFQIISPWNFHVNCFCISKLQICAAALHFLDGYPPYHFNAKKPKTFQSKEPKTFQRQKKTFPTNIFFSQCAQQHKITRFISNWNEYDRSDSFPFDYESNDLPLGS